MKECPNCHAMIEAGDKFCTSCGFKFTEQVATQQQPAQENQPVQPAQQQTQPVQQQAPQQPVQQNNENMEKLKSNSKSYWNWLVTSLKNPGSDQKADSKWYGVLTIVLEAVIPLGLLYFSLNSAISKFGNFSSQIADTVGSIIFGLLIFSIATKLIEILISYYMNNMLFTEKYTKRISYLDYVTKIMNKSGLCVVTCAIVSATVLFTGSKLSDFLTSQNLISSIFNPSEAIQSIIGFATGVGFFIAIPKFIGDIAVLVSCFHEIFTAEGNLKKNRIIVAWLFAIVLLVVDILIICMFLPSASK